jgi:hypothetical protein
MSNVKQDLAIGDSETIGDLCLQLLQDNELRLAGKLDDDASQAALRRRLEELHGNIRARNVASFTVDLRSLNFVNSSAIRLFVDWIARAEADDYTLVFVIDRSITWHRLSFSVLKSLAPSRVQIVEGSAIPPQASSA